MTCLGASAAITSVTWISTKKYVVIIRCYYPMKNLQMSTVSHRQQPSLMFASIKTFGRPQWGAWRECRHETLAPENKNYRFISYKQQHKRKPLPNCVITKIREIYPEEGGNCEPCIKLEDNECGQKDGHNIICMFSLQLHLLCKQNSFTYLFWVWF